MEGGRGSEVGNNRAETGEVVQSQIWCLQGPRFDCYHFKDRLEPQSISLGTVTKLGLSAGRGQGEKRSIGRVSPLAQVATIVPSPTTHKTPLRNSPHCLEGHSITVCPRFKAGLQSASLLRAGLASFKH